MKKPRIFHAGSKALLIAALCSCSLFGFATPGQARSDAVQIQHSRILLGNLSATLPRALESVDVGPAPAPGQRSRITRAGIRSALRRAGADPGFADALPTIIDIERSAKRIEAPELNKEIANAIASQLPKGVKIAQINSVPDLTLPVGAHQLSVRLGPLRSSTSATVKVTSEGAMATSFPVQILLSGTPKLPVLTEKVKRNAIVKRKQVRMQPTKWSQVSSRAALRPEQLVGQRARQALAAGRVLAHSAVAKPPVVARGHEVSVAAIGQGIRIVLPATAQEDGMMGQYIRVRPLSGTRTLRAKVVSANEVRIKLESLD